MKRFKIQATFYLLTHLCFHFFIEQVSNKTLKNSSRSEILALQAQPKPLDVLLPCIRMPCRSLSQVITLSCLLHRRNCNSSKDFSQGIDLHDYLLAIEACRKKRLKKEGGLKTSLFCVYLLRPIGDGPARNNLHPSQQLTPVAIATGITFLARISVARFPLKFSFLFAFFFFFFFLFLEISFVSSERGRRRQRTERIKTGEGGMNREDREKQPIREDRIFNRPASENRGRTEGVMNSSISAVPVALTVMRNVQRVRETGQTINYAVLLRFISANVYERRWRCASA